MLLLECNLELKWKSDTERQPMKLDTIMGIAASNGRTQTVEGTMTMIAMVMVVAGTATARQGSDQTTKASSGTPFQVPLF